TVVLALLVPLLEAHDDVDALSLAHARHPKKVLDVEDAETPHLDVMPQKIGRRSKDHRGRAPITSDHIIRHQPMPAQDELELALALADPALAEQEQSHAEDVDQDAVKLGLGGEALVEDGVDR